MPSLTSAPQANSQTMIPPNAQMAPQQMSDPLAQLRDIHLPDAVSAWPPAPGWWLLSALLLTLAMWAGYRLHPQHRRNAYRRQALQELTALQSDTNVSATQTIARLNALLKRVALHAYSKSPTAALNGSEWVEFLNTTCPALSQKHGTTNVEIFQAGPYQAEINENMFNRSSLFTDCRLWIQQHVNAAELEKIPQTSRQSDDATVEAT